MGGPSVPTAHAPNYIPQSDQAAYQNQKLQSDQATSGNTLATNVINNPYSGSVIPGAEATGSYLTGTLAPQLQGASTSLSNAANASLPMSQQLLNYAFDPNNALYARTAQQVSDAQQAANSAAGIANTPYGAGIAGQTATNFNIDWQNNQLQRAISGLAGYDTNLGAVGGAQTTAANLGRGGAEAQLIGSGLPYSTYNAMQGAGLAALGQASNLAGSAEQSSLGYLDYSVQEYQNQLRQQQQVAKQWQDMWSGISSDVGTLIGAAAGA